MTPASGPGDPGALERRLGYRFRSPATLETALTHPSCSSETPGIATNERLEFLGDAVLDLVVAERLYERHPDWREGQLTRARAALVNTRSLAEQSLELGVDTAARLGRTEREPDGGTRKPSILANLFEAVLGAIYLDGGLEPVRAVVLDRFGELLDSSGEEILVQDPKTRFQEWAHARFQETPRYRGLEDSGVESSEDRFRVEVHVQGERWGQGAGRTKRAAERAAASDALERALAPAPEAPPPPDPTEGSDGARRG